MRKQVLTDLALYVALVLFLQIGWVPHVCQSSEILTTNIFLRLNWTNTSLLYVSVAEPQLVVKIKEFFQTPNVSVIDIRESTFPAVLPLSSSLPSNSTFQLLFQIQNTSTTAEASTFLNGNMTALQAALITQVNETTSSFFSDNNSTRNHTLYLSVEWLSTADAQALGPFGAVIPTPNTTNYMLPNVVFRNLLSVQHLTQSLLYQTRIGIARFLGLLSLTDIQVLGAPEVPTATVLLLVQRFYLQLAHQNVTLGMRETLANLMIYGDPSRPILDANTGNSRASMFLDHVFIPAEVSAAIDAAKADALSVMSACLSYVFRSVMVDQFPPGNPPPPASPAPSSSTITPALSEQELQAKMRKKQRFLYKNPADLVSFPNTTNVSYPSSSELIQSNGTSTCSSTSGFCTYIYWSNTLGNATFWLENMQSVERVHWDLFPTTILFASIDGNDALPSPFIYPGNTSTPIWTFSALSGAPNRLDFALNLRNVDDNVTSLTIEIATDILSPVEASSTITSIARHSPSPLSTSHPPIYETKSNIVVTYETRFRNANELFLFLKITNSTVTQKDTSQPCAHCQNLFELCLNEPRCSPIANCVFAEGIDAAEIPSHLLQTGQIQEESVDLWSYFANCFTSTTTTTDVDALMLFTSAVRCQMQRLCAFRRISEDDPKILLWQSEEAHQRLEIHPALPLTQVRNVFVKLGPHVLCYLPISVNTTALSLEETLTKRCRYGNYLGRVSVFINQTTENLINSVDIRYKYLVGPLPTLETVVNGDATMTASNAGNTDIVITVNNSSPGIRLRLETKDFQTALPSIPATPVEDPCSICKRLALDGCLRDMKCIAFTDCITRFSSTLNSTTSYSSSLGEAIVSAFQRNAVGEKLSFSAAVDACHSIEHVNLPEWRKLVNASACFSRHNCPISLQLLVPAASSIAGKWRMEPSVSTQRLIYQEQPENFSSNAALHIPIQLIGQDGAILHNTTSLLSAFALQTKLVEVLEYDNITVMMDLDTESQNNTAQDLRIIQWTIQYDHWLGDLPFFLPTNSTPTWTLFTYPPVPEYYLEIVNATSIQQPSSTNMSSASITVEEQE